MNECLVFLHYLIVSFLVLSTLSCQTEQKEDNGGSYALMGRGYGINGSTLFVENLDSARKHFTEVLGFHIPKFEKVRKGIVEGTVTTAIPFPDMSSIELL